MTAALPAVTRLAPLERADPPRPTVFSLHRSNFPAIVAMEKALWYLLAGTRGGANRTRIIRRLSDRPRNANQLADDLDVSYKTVRHHLEMLEDHGVVETGGDEYGKLYFLTDRFEHHRDTFQTITEDLE